MCWGKGGRGRGGRRSVVAYALNKIRRCAPRQGTLLTRALSGPRSNWIPGRTAKACVFQWFRAPKMAAVLYAHAPRGVEMACE